MRAIILILIIAVVVVMIGIATGYLDINQTRAAKAPELSLSRSGVTAKAGRAPAFDVETGSVSLSTKPKQVAVPTVQVNPPAGGNQANEVTANGG